MWTSPELLRAQTAGGLAGSESQVLEPRLDPTGWRVELPRSLALGIQGMAQRCAHRELVRPRWGKCASLGAAGSKVRNWGGGNLGCQVGESGWS